MEEYVRQVNTNIELSQENERLNNELKLYKDNHEHLNNLLQQKDNIINEAIEYIKTLDYENEETYDIGEYTRNELLEILGGSDDK